RRMNGTLSSPIERRSVRVLSGDVATAVMPREGPNPSPQISSASDPPPLSAGRAADRSWPQEAPRPGYRLTPQAPEFRDLAYIQTSRSLPERRVTRSRPRYSSSGITNLRLRPVSSLKPVTSRRLPGGQ